MIFKRLIFFILHPSAFILRFYPPRCEHWRQRKRNNQTYGNRRRARQTERRHKASDNSGHKTDGNKYGEKRKRRRQNRQTDFACSFNLGLKRMHSLFFDKTVNIFQHDNRVVNHDADHQG